MRLTNYVLAAAFVVGVAGSTAAQSVPAPVPGPPVFPEKGVGTIKSHWLASGSIGREFSQADNILNRSDRDRLTFGGQLGYLWRGVLGGEFLADSGKTGQRTNIALLEGPRVNSYMGNIIAALPFGADGQYQPYVSGGWGDVQMEARLLATATVTSVDGKPVAAVINLNKQTTGGTNIGFGFMGYAGNVGVRADVRQYMSNVITNFTGTGDDQLTQTLLSDLNFWRANIGIAFQW